MGLVGASGPAFAWPESFFWGGGSFRDSVAFLIGVVGVFGCGDPAGCGAPVEKLGVHIIDTDVIAHEIVEPNSDCLNELVDYFGDSILNDDKTLNRKKLASIAFSDKQKNRGIKQHNA